MELKHIPSMRQRHDHARVVAGGGRSTHAEADSLEPEVHSKADVVVAKRPPRGSSELVVSEDEGCIVGVKSAASGWVMRWGTGGRTG